MPAARLLAVARWLPLVVATATLAHATISAVLARVGHPAAALDDAYIHFQYARAIAEGHPLRYQAGEPISTGATSLIWPALLAPFHLLGLRGEGLLWAAWAFSFAALGALAYEAHALTRPLAGRAAAVGAAAMTLAFGGFLWTAASGMEGVAFAWLLARAARRGAEWAELPPVERTRRRLVELGALAVLGPLVRPEGALFAVALGLVVAACPQADDAPSTGAAGARPARRVAKAFALASAAALPNVLLLVLTGRASSSTAQVKLLVGNPYYVVADAALANARLFVTTLLDGEVWSAEFLPKGSAPFACAGLVAIALRGHITGRRARAALVLLLALTMLVPCLYVTFLWNRLRYLWPFATGWLVGLACLARVAAGLFARLIPSAGAASTLLLTGTAAGLLASRLEGVIDDVAQSASGISRQQVALGHWVDENLPRGASVGVNDTGAIAYFGNRLTFDIVGLTTPSEGHYWVAGAASRLEHYERLHQTSPHALPTHFAVYPEWMACPPVLGRALHEAVVTDSTILGGQIMRVYEARWELLGSGEAPWTLLASVRDAVDVADLESEAEHRYELLGARDGEQTADEGNAPDGRVLADGGRTERRRDRFVVRGLTPGKPVTAIARVRASGRTTLRMSASGKAIGEASLDDGPWTEVSFTIPADLVQGSTAIEMSAEGEPFTSFHYWFGE